MRLKTDNGKTAILVLMPYWHVNFEQRLFKLVEILRRSYEVYFCVLTKEMVQRKEIYAPAVPKERLSLPHFSKINAQPINSLRQLRRYLLKSNFVISGTTKGLQRVSDQITMFRLPYMLINDIGDSTPFTYGQDVLILPGEAFRRNTVFNKSFLKDQIHITGDIRFDSINDVVSNPQKEVFLKKYKLDKNQKFVVFCTGPFQRIYKDVWLRSLYKKIVECVRKNGFEVLIRLHQNDYAGHKRPAEVKVTSNLLLFPEIHAIDPLDIEIAMKLCSYMVSVESSVALESSIFRKNAVVVNLHEYSLTQEGREKSFFPKKRFNGFGIKSLYKGSDNTPIQSEFLESCGGPYLSKYLRVIEFDWVGADCDIDELEQVLRSSELLSVDQSLCEKHIEKFWHKSDGNASLRIADLAEQMINDPKFRKRVFMPKSKRVLSSLVFIAKKSFMVLSSKVRSNLGIAQHK